MNTFALKHVETIPLSFQLLYAAKSLFTNGLMTAQELCLHLESRQKNLMKESLSIINILWYIKGVLNNRFIRFRK